MYRSLALHVDSSRQVGKRRAAFRLGPAAVPCLQFNLSCQLIIIFKIRHTCNYDLTRQRYTQFMSAMYSLGLPQLCGGYAPTPPFACGELKYRRRCSNRGKYRSEDSRVNYRCPYVKRGKYKVGSARVLFPCGVLEGV